MQLDRHQIVQLDPVAWRTLIAARPELEPIPAVAGWVSLGHPLIARRRLCSDDAGHVPLGLPLPPSMGKQRLAFAVLPAAVRSASPPPRLADAVHAAPVAWHGALADVVANDAEVRCFGSLAWQHLTGLPYLSATSDVDLLWQRSTREDADRLVAAVASIDAQAPMRVDGEIVTPGGLAIQWREWAGGAAELLGKSGNGNRMVARTAVFV